MSLWTDLRHAGRSLLRDRAYTTIALLTLAFGIAANTVIFSIVDGVLLRPLGYPEPGRLVVVNEIVLELAGQYPRLPANARHYFEWRDRSTTFEQIAIVDAGNWVLTGGGSEPERLEGARISANLLPMLGARPVIGRLFREEEDRPGGGAVVVISEALWARRFNRDPGAVGRPLTLDGVPATIVGVLPAAFHLPKSQPGGITRFPHEADAYKPIAFDRAALSWWGELNYSVIGRLRPGVTRQQALAELNVLQAGIATHLPDNLHLAAHVAGLQDEVTGTSRTPLLFLLGAVGAVLLIVCVNLANLAIARGAARAHDLAIRRALGATRGLLVRATLAESLLLGVLGGLLGTALAWVGLKVILSRAPIDLPRLDEVHLDARALLFALGLSVLTGFLFGLLPAWRAATMDPQRSLRDGARGATDGRGGRITRHALVAVESALGAVLLVVAGLLIGSFFRLLAVDKGFDAQHVLAAPLTLPQRAYSTPALRETYYRNLVAKLQAMPGVTDAALVSRMPLDGEDWVDMVQRQGESRPIAELPPVNYRFCSPGYFKAMGIAFSAGGTFTEADRDRNLAVISEAAARAIWPGEDPVGKRFTRGDPSEPLFEVAGVVRDVSVALDKKPVVTVYVPYWVRNRPYMTVVLRTASDPRAVGRSLRQAVWGLDPDTVILEVQTMESLVSGSVAGRRFQMVLTAGFAASALLLACVGIYGVVAWSVARRRNEIGVRMALGAGGGEVRRMVVLQGLRPVAAGLAIGMAGALALSGVVSSLLFGVSARDPLTYVVVAVTLGTVAALA
ncbi:MAG TPA: ABC transporter permease, partial [Vicinamibacterales bacterium]|nr:ABC transporter permease [Vicinamibacterales bacterium]